jgi:hypothetical protein
MNDFEDREERALYTTLLTETHFKDFEKFRKAESKRKGVTVSRKMALRTLVKQGLQKSSLRQSGEKLL